MQHFQVIHDEIGYAFIQTLHTPCGEAWVNGFTVVPYLTASKELGSNQDEKDM